MAKINARGAHRVGPTFFTRKVKPPAYAGDVERTYFEAFRVRSDGMIQTRIMRTEYVEDGVERTTKHSSGFRNLFPDNSKMPTPASSERLKNWLLGRGFEIVEESWR